MAATKSGGSSMGYSRQQQQQKERRSFWFCFAGLQLCLCAAMIPLCWLVLAPGVASSLSTVAVARPIGVLPAVIVTSVGAGFSLASVTLLCVAQAAPAMVAASPGCPARLLWLRIFTAGAGLCAQLATVGLLLHAASQVLAVADVATAASVAALAGLAAVNGAQAAAAVVHIYNCVTAVQLTWRIVDEDQDEEGEGDGESEAEDKELKTEEDKRSQEAYSDEVGGGNATDDLADANGPREQGARSVAR